jgi:hypothetical protein
VCCLFRDFGGFLLHYSEGSLRAARKRNPRTNEFGRKGRAPWSAALSFLHFSQHSLDFDTCHSSVNRVGGAYRRWFDQVSRHKS